MICLIVMLLVSPVAPSSAQAQTEQPDRFILKLEGGHEFLGQLHQTEEPREFAWACPWFTDPFRFPLPAVSGVVAIDRRVTPRAIGEFGVELVNGDSFYGSIEDWNAQTAVFSHHELGRLEFDVSSIRRVYRWNSGQQLIYSGPNGLLEWKMPSGEGIFADRGHLVLNQAGAEIRGNISLPQRCRVDLELAWASRPDFVLAIGVDEELKELDHAYRFEVWDDEIVFLRVGNQKADIVSVGRAEQFFSNLKLTLFLDQSVGKATVYKADGSVLGSLQVNDATPAAALPFIVLRNQGGPLRLKHLRVVASDDVGPIAGEAQEPRIQKLDGTHLQGAVTGYDAGTKSLLISNAENSTSPIAVPINQLSYLKPQVAEESNAAPATVQSDLFNEREVGPDGSVRTVSTDGVTLTGVLVRCDPEAIVIKPSRAREPIRVPISRLLNMTCLDAAAQQETAKLQPLERLGTLTMDGVSSRGALVGGMEGGDASCLVWRPTQALNASPLRKGVSGRIVYRETALISNTNQAQNAVLQRIRIQGRAPRLGGNQDVQRAIDAAQSERSPRLYLRSGDVIPCVIKQLDESGATIESTASLATHVAHDEIKAIDFGVGLPLDALADDKRLRLLTLPRMMRKTPPRHVVASVTGDYLRGNVESLDAEFLTVENRLESLKIPRQGVSQIIYFHDEDLPSGKPEKEKPEEPPPADLQRIQAICRNGVRLTLKPAEASMKSIMGPSVALGVCQIAISDIDVLLLGKEVGMFTKQQRYQDWKLQDAPDPKVLTEPPVDEQAGTASPLVGKPAPAIELNTVDGFPFKLTELQGKVVVLDFWASWCGPCIQAMPRIHEAVHEFAETDVQLVAVNLEENAAQVRTMLQRLQLAPLTVLDEEGTVAQAYQAQAIPQTVVIDRTGTVTHVFVGGGAQLGDQLRAAIKSALMR